ncbi:CopG family ribbon-helix-helix protein [Aquibium microcysteis]|uniref:CopG family ribbon-helix-helix protein n=1 Tax=Aquibium microcysteis TaxID=675281 RepID=UPI00165D0D29|nr:ribbon-helix-helix protein, CopG family [Aquibium microcysteis]
MGEVPLSLHVTAETKRELEEHARQLNVSVAEIAERAIASYLEIPARERAILKERLAEADKGVFISSEAMMRWMESWDTDEELPPPEPDVFLPPRRR